MSQAIRAYIAATFEVFATLVVRDNYSNIRHMAVVLAHAVPSCRECESNNTRSTWVPEP